MSTQTYPIKCPQCTTEQQVELYEAVRVKEAPELRDELLANRLNRVNCENCGFSFRVDKNLLYYDADRAIMIYLLPTDDEHVLEGEEQFRQWLQTMNGILPDTMEPPQIHLVFSYTELVERIFLLEAELDVRLVEYVKYMIYCNNLERLLPEQKRILFNAEDSTDEDLCFVTQDIETLQLEDMLKYSRKAYDALHKMFDEDTETANLLELFPGPYINARFQMLREADEACNPETGDEPLEEDE